jgi:hypothetical protein
VKKKGKKEGGSGSRKEGYLVERQQQQATVAAATTTTTATKRFESSNPLKNWLDAPTTSRLYRILFIDWTKNQAKVECIPFVPDAATKAAEDSKRELESRYEYSEAAFAYWRTRN